MSIKTKIAQSLDVTFSKNSMIDSHLKDGPSRRIEQKGVIMDKPSKSPMINVDDENEGEEK